MTITYLNGAFVEHKDAMVHIEDRGYQFADGVYEVVALVNGTWLDWQAHCDRLRRSLEIMRIDWHQSDTALKAIIDELAERNHQRDGALYLQITRGVAPRNHAIASGLTPSVSAYLLPPKAKNKALYENGMAAITVPDERWKRRDAKTIALAPASLAKQTALDEGVHEAVMHEDGIITECSASNLFIIRQDGTLQTHPANEKILAGITRAAILRLAEEHGIAMEETPFAIDEMKAASEAFITSTTMYAVPLTQLDGAAIGDGKSGPVTKKLMDAYAAYVAEQCA